MIYKKEKTVSYDDICLVPQYSDLTSRSEACISQFGFRNPIINSPMIHTTSPEMLRFLLDNNMMCTIHRYFKSAEEQLNYVKDAVGDDYYKVYFSVGKCTDWIQFLINSGISLFIVDMAHGDSETCVKAVKYIRSNCHDAVIIAGNVATKEGYTRLILAGASAVRVGIAGGCFTGDMVVCTPSGNSKISKIKKGDSVISHTGESRVVNETISWLADEEMIKINGICSTKTHEYYVLDKKYSDVVTDENIHDYATWIPASELNNNFLLIRHK